LQQSREKSLVKMTKGAAGKPDTTLSEISAKGAILKGVGCLATIAKGGMGLGL
jgi:hypothetical protein